MHTDVIWDQQQFGVEIVAEERMKVQVISWKQKEMSIYNGQTQYWRPCLQTSIKLNSTFDSAAFI